jgi:hypothetical protein
MDSSLLTQKRLRITKRMEEEMLDERDDDGRNGLIKTYLDVDDDDVNKWKM